MSYLQELTTELEQQKKETDIMEVLESVDAVHSYIPADPNAVSNETIAIEMCVLTRESFGKGWHYVLIDKIAAETFKEAEVMVKGLKPDRFRKRTFELTVWQPKKHARNEKLINPGCLPFCDAVSKLKFWKSLKYQGEALYEAVMKSEKHGDSEPTPEAPDTHSETAIAATHTLFT